MRYAGLENTRFFQRIFLSRNSLALSLQFVGLLLTFGCNILLARLYGDHAYGVFSLVSGWAVLFSVIGLFGMDDRHLAQVPALNLKGDKQAVTAELFGSLKINLITVVLSVVLFFLLIRYSGVPLFSANYHFFLYSLMLIPCYVFMNNLLYFLRAMKWIIKGEIADKVIRPLAFALFVTFFYYFSKPATPGKALLANVSGLLIVIVPLAFFVRSSLIKIPSASNNGKLKFKAALNFRYTVLNLLYILSIRLDFLLLGLFVNASQLGHYNIASRFGDIFSYPVAMLNLSFPAMLSEKIHHQNEEQASLFPFKTARNAFWLCLLTGVLFILFAPWFFSLYGKDFGEAVHILPIFLLATLVNASAGLSDVLFIMTGKEKKVIICRILALITTAISAAFLIPHYAMTGAACSMLAGNIMYYSMLQFYYWKAYHHIVNPFFRPVQAR